MSEKTFEKVMKSYTDKVPKEAFFEYNKLKTLSDKIPLSELTKLFRKFYIKYPEYEEWQRRAWAEGLLGNHFTETQ